MRRASFSRSETGKSERVVKSIVFICKGYVVVLTIIGKWF